MAEPSDLEARLRRLEDESAIQRVHMSYGPPPIQACPVSPTSGSKTARGSNAVDSMLQSDGHRRLMSEARLTSAVPYSSTSTVTVRPPSMTH